VNIRQRGHSPRAEHERWWAPLLSLKHTPGFPPSRE